ncbi:unnamed protein product [Aspergillus oryzae]|uniref:Unnamed protein product n=2 Tax=Aspergillus oryzae TaxID=5062 RepID=A0AAN4YK35_ASPOZ|nr:unnamed protein product [Aspergillus oryzae]GMF83252.1 unnamed protein product [Aspergillus oryzae]GMG02097.1 unnamed protein product [Aspergillus oryzae]GMG31648.1 unnamed protein product [Aspergillus oryzae]GMG41676.1 unnamed protein product [Aspergillus oryzae var. brunneus]
MTVTSGLQMGSLPTPPLEYVGYNLAEPKSSEQVCLTPQQKIEIDTPNSLIDYLWASGLPPVIWRKEHSTQAHASIQRMASDSPGEGRNYKRDCQSIAHGISALRRGKPVAHSIFGVAQTINSANYAYFLAQQKLSSLHSTRANDVFVEELLNLHRGQGMDLHWRDTLTCPTEEQYIGMVLDKTGGLFRLAVKLMQLESNQTCGGEYTKNKGFCEDITEGKFSFPIIHSINSDPRNMQLMNILRQRSEDNSLKAYAVDYITSTRSFTYSYQKLNSLIAEAKSMVEELDAQMGPSRGMCAFLEMLNLN